VKIALETDLLSLGVVVLRGAALPTEYDPLPDPEPLPGREIGTARKLYRAIGQDPTRNRPASEALLRRLKRGIGLPRINALVDAVNHCSVRLLRPFGSYDLGKIRGDVTLRLGREGEWYEGHGKPRVNLAGRYVLADDIGPFGNPSSDSVRTAIHEDTTDALIVVFGPAGDREDHLDWVGETLAGAVGGAFETKLVRP
jgi:DNA/RNA-binding domain of Phe-tRNA-synthetase-like protein